MARELVRDLRGLRDARAPSTLLPAVLGLVGLSDFYVRYDSPIGRCYVAFNDHGVSAVMRATTDEDFVAAFRERFGRPVGPAAEAPTALRHALDEWTHARVPSSLRFDLRGLSEFEQAVLRKALEIPPGEVRPYSWVAREIGRPKAVRAVGTALGGNPIPLLIPCHRVVRRDGHIGEYGLGADAKRVVLAAEGIDPDELEKLARVGIRYFGSDTTHIFCLPTCRHARRVTTRHRVTFRSEAEAVLAGYRACKVCRPA
jgi:O-6-methylguanine DNA methyltransferase